MILFLFLGVVSSHLLSGLFSFKEKWGVPTGPDVTTGQNCMYIIHQTFVQNKVINIASFFSSLFSVGLFYFVSKQDLLTM